MPCQRSTSCNQPRRKVRWPRHDNRVHAIAEHSPRQSSVRVLFGNHSVAVRNGQGHCIDVKHGVAIPRRLPIAMTHGLHLDGNLDRGHGADEPTTRLAVLKHISNVGVPRRNPSTIGSMSSREISLAETTSRSRPFRQRGSESRMTARAASWSARSCATLRAASGCHPLARSLAASESSFGPQRTVHSNSRFAWEERHPTHLPPTGFGRGRLCHCRHRRLCESRPRPHRMADAPSNKANGTLPVGRGSK